MLAAAVIGSYHQSQDMVQTAAIIQDDGVSVHRSIKVGTVRLMHQQNVIAEYPLVPAEYNEGEGGFYTFFLHPTKRMGLRVRMDVELQDGRTAKSVNTVEAQDETPETNATNPMLPLRPTLDYTNQWDPQGRTDDWDDQHQIRRPV